MLTQAEVFAEPANCRIRINAGGPMLKFVCFSGQLSTKLKLGVMYDHNGTYMESITLRYQEASIVIDVDEVKAPHLNGKSIRY